MLFGVSHHDAELGQYAIATIALLRRSGPEPIHHLAVVAFYHGIQQRLLAGEEVIKAAFHHCGFKAQSVEANGVVALALKQALRGGQDFFPGGMNGLHRLHGQTLK
jgi:hypothetical protein